MNKIFILLPHKDQFLKNNSGSASIWVKDFFKLSKFKKKNRGLWIHNKSQRCFNKKNL